MTEGGAYPDPQRVASSRSIFQLSSLAAVAEAISRATEEETRIYVERSGDAWRWSLTHRGGMYPLLRVSARFLRMDYHRLVVGFRRLPDGIFVLAGDPRVDPQPEAWAVIEFDGPTKPDEVERRILAAFKPKGPGSPLPPGEHPAS